MCTNRSVSTGENRRKISRIVHARHVKSGECLNRSDALWVAELESNEDGRSKGRRPMINGFTAKQDAVILLSVSDDECHEERHPRTR